MNHTLLLDLLSPRPRVLWFRRVRHALRLVILGALVGGIPVLCWIWRSGGGQP